MCSLASPSIIPRLLSPGAQAACDAVLLGVSPLPVLPSAQERQEHASQGDKTEAQGPWPERASGTGGPPQAGETRRLVGWHPPLACRLGSSRGASRPCCPVCLPKVAPSPWASLAPPPLPQPPHRARLAPSAAHPSPPAARPGLEFF